MKALIYFISFFAPVILMAQSLEQEIQSYRDKQIQEMVKDEFGPLRKDQVEYVTFYPAKQDYVVTAEVEQLFNEPTFRMPTYDGTSNEYKRYGFLNFELNGKKYKLTAYQRVALFQNATYKNHLFVPFMDNTTGETSYEGGRYLDLSISDIKDGKIKIDFNRAYNPYCAYSNGYRCPQPPKDNILNAAIEAGEKKYNGPKNERNVNKSTAKNFNDFEKSLINTADENSLMHVYQITDEKELAVLKKPSEDIKFDDPLLDKIAARMLLTVKDPEHPGVGIAGPQVGINKNVIWVQRLDKKDEPFEFYLNPKIIWRSKLTRQGAEGCLSIPDLRQDVKRSYAIKLQHIDRKGQVKEELIEGFTAVIFQHEVDHLYGILFPDRIEESNKIEFESLNDKPDFFIQKGSIRP
ncbi:MULTISPECIES: peptide deformylase [unclassified Sphingobacterium]|uniref:peptide deformylase n=1 Tax=unclassified Sphingobacterium TaxID=2609468 RepID=UPI0020C32B60|nr:MULTISPECIES: peptide deformylase [unclassified Sphingobacterium]